MDLPSRKLNRIVCLERPPVVLGQPRVWLRPGRITNRQSPGKWITILAPVSRKSAGKTPAPPHKTSTRQKQGQKPPPFLSFPSNYSGSGAFSAILSLKNLSWYNFQDQHCLVALLLIKVIISKCVKKKKKSLVSLKSKGCFQCSRAASSPSTGQSEPALLVSQNGW